MEEALIMRQFDPFEANSLVLAAFPRDDSSEIFFVRREIRISFNRIVYEREVELDSMRERGGIEFAAPNNKYVVRTFRFPSGIESILDRVHYRCSGCGISSIAGNHDIGASRERPESLGEGFPGLSAHDDRVAIRQGLESSQVRGDMPQQIAALADGAGLLR